MGFNTAVRREDGCVILEVDTSFFCKDAILKTSYQFTEQCYFKVETVGEGAARVAISPKEPGTDVERIVPEFLNQLIDQELRVRVQQETAEIHRLIVSEAFAPLEVKEGSR